MLKEVKSPKGYDYAELGRRCVRQSENMSKLVRDLARAGYALEFMDRKYSKLERYFDSMCRENDRLRKKLRMKQTKQWRAWKKRHDEMKPKKKEELDGND
jgi:hypothetical protein